MAQKQEYKDEEGILASSCWLGGRNYYKSILCMIPGKYAEKHDIKPAALADIIRSK